MAIALERTVIGFDCVVRNGRVATASDVFRADIGIREGRIAAVGEGLPHAPREIDAAGMLVLPGGIDGHCHVDQPPYGGVELADDFRTGSVSAAFGGTTTLIPFAFQQAGQSLRDAVDDYHRRAAGKAMIDYAFHVILSDPAPAVLRELPAMVRDGYSSFKIYMTYEGLRLRDRQVLDVLDAARREGAMVMVHAENDDCISWLTERLLEAGKRAPKYHALAHPEAGEREAAHRAISLAEIIDVPILIVHVSARSSMEQISHAQRRGLRVYGETCPQYLFLTAQDLDQEGFAGAKCICSPPPRDLASQQAIWQGLQAGVFQVFSSDHSPFRYGGAAGKKIHGDAAPFSKVPNGIPGIETRLPLLFSEGVMGGRIDLPRFVALTATNVARLYGLYPRKGTIAVGADADLAVWDPSLRVTISNSLLHHNVDYTPYEGRVVQGWPRWVLSRGELIVEDGKLAGAPGRGRFLRCDRPEAARPSGAARVFDADAP